MHSVDRNFNTFQAIVKSEPSYGEYTKKDLYTPYYPDPPHGRGMIGNTCLKKKEHMLKFGFLRRDDGLRSTGWDGCAHTRVVVKAFTISRLSCQVPMITCNCYLLILLLLFLLLSDTNKNTYDNCFTQDQFNDQLHLPASDLLSGIPQPRWAFFATFSTIFNPLLFR